jgi:ribosomal protein S18 acetylase RimI-like enzyme
MELPLGIKARRAQRSDGKFVYRITREAFLPIIAKIVDVNEAWPRFKQQWEQRWREFLILQRGKRRMGVLLMRDAGRTLHIDKIYLSPAYHRKGMGTEIMKHLETLGHRRVQLEVWKVNPALSLYKRLGYKVVSHKEHKYVMAKDIRR